MQRHLYLLSLLMSCTSLLTSGATQGAGVAVDAIHGRYCTAAAPPDWSVTAENPSGSAFGADFARRDGAGLASYMIFGVPPEMRASPVYQQWYATPEQGVMAQLTQFGARAMNCSRPSALGAGYMTMDCQTPGLHGIAAYKVYDTGNGGYVVVLRTAGAPDPNWNRMRAEATAVARSVQCQVPLTSGRYESPLPSASGKRTRGDDGDSEYSPWLGMETYHDRATGQNYWVSPTHDWDDVGPQGPGYYVTTGSEVRKLEPGMAQ